jgi:hypothetical protein
MNHDTAEHPATLAQRLPDLVQRALLCALIALTVISSPRILLASIRSFPNMPLDFQTISLSVGSYPSLALIVFTLMRLALHAGYRAAFGHSMSRVMGGAGALLWAALAVWMAVSAAWAVAPELARFTSLHVVMGIFVALIMADAVIRHGDRWALWALIGGAAVQAAIGLLQVLNGGPLGLGGLGETPRLWYEPTNFFRASALSMHANYLGGYLMLALFACLILIGRGWPNRAAIRLPILAAGLIGAGLVATLSRSAMLSTAVGLGPLILIGVFSLRGRLRTFVIGSVALAGVAAVLLALIVVRGDVATRFLMGREFFFDASWQVIQRFPILGVGAGSLMAAVGEMQEVTLQPVLPVHNVYLFIWAEVGIIGMGLYVAALATVLLRVRVRQHGWAGLVWGCAFVALAFVSLFDNYPWAIPPHQLITFWALGLWWGYTLRPDAAVPAH